MGLVTLTTDFGTQDGYVGAMKGVILSLSPYARIVDLTHAIPPQDVSAAAFALAQAAPYFPEGTVHVVVVDPGVGGDRHGVVVDDGRQRFVGPDNGVFELAVPLPRAAYEITAPGFRRGTVAATFHGRDVFAPAAGRLSAGAQPEGAGALVELVGTLAAKKLHITKDGSHITGHVVHVDHFGNLITDIPAARLPERARVRVGKLVLTRIVRTYADVPPGKPLAYVGSAATLELAVREGSAAKKLGMKMGSPVVVSA
jgi:S-adenosylmethionine hydrolase